MTIKRLGLLALPVALVVAALLVACGGRGGDAEPTVASPPPAIDNDATIDASVRQTVAAIAVAQTVAALTTGQPTPAAATPTTSAAEPSPTEAAPPATPEPDVAAACRVVGGVNLRAGPGTAYDPPLGSLGINTQLAPLAYVAAGYPQGPWLQVRIQPTGQVGWVSALPEWVVCDVDPATLPPPGNIPATPPPPTAPPPPLAPTATPPLASAPPDIDNDAPGGSFPSENVRATVVVDPQFLMRMEVADLTVGQEDGAGVEFVEFSITGNGIDYYRQENNAHYCVFGGGEPVCNPWPTDDQGRFTWGAGGPLVANGEYFASITVTTARDDPEFGRFWNWNFPFRVTLP